jgi:hypothetical protein
MPSRLRRFIRHKSRRPDATHRLDALTLTATARRYVKCSVNALPRLGPSKR